MIHYIAIAAVVLFLAGVCLSRRTFIKYRNCEIEFESYESWSSLSMFLGMASAVLGFISVIFTN